VPTIRGPVGIAASNAPGGFQLELEIPGNVSATIMLPAPGVREPVALVDGVEVSGVLSNNWLMLPRLGAGQHELCLKTPNAPRIPTARASRQKSAALNPPAASAIECRGASKTGRL